MATGDQTLINFPRESTMQEISQALQTMAFTQSADLEKISTWAQFSGLSRNGITQKIFDFGDQILEKWTDTAANSRNTTSRGISHTLILQNWRMERISREPSWKLITPHRSACSLATVPFCVARMGLQPEPTM